MDWFSTLFAGAAGLTLGNVGMMIVGGILIYLAIAKEYEPMLLLPIGVGGILANIPDTGLTEPGGLLSIFYQVGIANELFPSLIFIGVGAMTDFGPLLENPKLERLSVSS